MASSLNENTVLLGDLNFDYKINETLSSNPLYYIESVTGMKQLVTDHTRVAINSSTLIDIILSSVSDSHVSTGVAKTSFSDHYMVSTQINASPVKMPSDHLTLLL